MLKGLFYTLISVYLSSKGNLIYSYDWNYHQISATSKYINTSTMPMGEGMSDILQPESFKKILISSPLSLITFLRTLIRIQTWFTVKSDTLTWSIRTGFKFSLQNLSPDSCSILPLPLSFNHMQFLSLPHTRYCLLCCWALMPVLILGCSFPPSLTCYLLFQISVKYYILRGLGI